MVDLAFIVIFGARWQERSVRSEAGQIYPCPTCGVDRQFRVFEARKVFTLYWLSLFTLERGPRYWRCEHCDNRYEIPGPGAPPVTPALPPPLG